MLVLLGLECSQFYESLAHLVHERPRMSQNMNGKENVLVHSEEGFSFLYELSYHLRVLSNLFLELFDLGLGLRWRYWSFH